MYERTPKFTRRPGILLCLVSRCLLPQKEGSPGRLEPRLSILLYIGELVSGLLAKWRAVLSCKFAAYPEAMALLHRHY
ncbi:hypothetical protein BDW22DRAFT_213657 [Trametopsis cervina]|nr:hypothetical protein BDW22DRAFT_213657 [Trametopsis cervina]